MSKVSRRPTRANRRKVKWERKFLGKVKDFTSPEERQQEQKHLRAYLKGKRYFRHGTKDILNPATGVIERYPNILEVQQQLTIK